MPKPTDSQLSEEEALVVQLFRGVAADVLEQTGSPRPSKRVRTGNVDEQLLEAERVFLAPSHGVTTANVKLEDVRSRFQSSEMPPEGARPEHVVHALIDSTVSDAVNTASPVMIGHMTSSLPYYARPLSRLITTMNQNAVKTETANTVTFLEREALAQLHRIMYNRDDAFYRQYGQDPSSALGVLCSGGTLANLTALWVARNRILAEVDGIGIAEAQRRANCPGGLVVVGSELLHYSVAKALDVLGLGSMALVRVPVDEQFRCPPAGVAAACERAVAEGKRVMCVVGLAGSTEAGSFDDLQGLARVCERFGAHFHVDAAWGGPAAFSPTHRVRLAGVHEADTITMDGHKQLYVPMGCGLLFFKDPSLSRAVRKTAGYIIRAESHDLGKFALEGSRPANAVYLHSNLQILGVNGYRILVDRSARMTQYMADVVRASSDFELLVDPPQSNILLYRAAPARFQTERSTAAENAALDERNVKLQERQKVRGRTFVSRTSLRSPLARHGGVRIVALRVVIANPLTYESDIDRVLADQRDILAELDKEAAAPAASSAAVATAPPAPFKPVTPHNASYWSSIWASMAPDARAIFRDSEEMFIGSLISPDLPVESGLFGDKERGIDVEKFMADS